MLAVTLTLYLYSVQVIISVSVSLASVYEHFGRRHSSVSVRSVEAVRSAMLTDSLSPASTDILLNGVWSVENVLRETT